MCFCRLFAWFIVLEALITMFGVMTAPLLLILAADAIVVLLIIRDCLELRSAKLARQNGNA